MKFFLALLFALHLTMPALAQPEIEIKIEKKYALENLTLDDLKMYPEINGQLTPTDRQLILNNLTLDSSTAIWGNLIPFGYGSFQQGDTFGGTSIAIMDIVSLYAFAGDLSVLNESAPIPLGFLIYVPLFLIARVTGVVSPILHANEHNESLQQLLKAPPTQLFSYSVSF